jgi:hypothetical protein
MQLIDKIKNVYGLKYIQLMDNSEKYCKFSHQSIQLWALKMLTTGETWYSNYDFVPFDEKNQTIHERNMQKLKHNKKIVSETKLKDTEILETLKDASLKMNIRFSDKTMDGFKKKYDNAFVKDFFTDFLKNYDKYCGIFSLAYDKIIIDLKLFNLYGMVYFKKL